MGKLTLIETERDHYEPKRWLRELSERLDKHYPGAESLVVIIGSKPDENGDITYAKTTNHLTRSHTLWMLEMGRECLLKAKE